MKAGLLASDLDSESSSKAAASPKSTFPRKRQSKGPFRHAERRDFESQVKAQSKWKTISVSDHPLIRFITIFICIPRVLNTKNAEIV